MKSRFLPCCLVALGLLPAPLRPVPAQRAQNAPESADSASGPAADYRGGLVSPPLPKPKIVLTDTSGAPYDLSVKTEGYVTLLFFGYAHCPDMCPLQMQVIAQALRKVPADIAAQFKVVFVTTDPQRDTPAVLRSWLDHFDKHFIGLTGSQAAIDAAQTAANLDPAQKSAATPNSAYGVNHAAFALAYTKDNLAHVIYPVGVKAEDLAHDLPNLVKETWQTALRRDSAPTHRQL
jgi:protein SCO1/2